MTESRRRARQRLRTLVASYDGCGSPQRAADLVGDLFAGQRMSEVAGEPIDVIVERSGPLSRHRLDFNLVGRVSGEEYVAFSWTFSTDAGDVNADVLTTYTLMLQASLNTPDQTYPWVLEALADRGVLLVGCDFCDAEFASVAEAAEHELQHSRD